MACVFFTLTVFAEAAQIGVLLPQDLLQPLGFVEVGEAVQATEQNCGQRAKSQVTRSAGPLGFSHVINTILTVFDEDVRHVLLEAVRHDVLVGLHHVGAEDPLVGAVRHVGPGRPGVGLQQFGAAGLQRKQSSQSAALPGGDQQ